jgi:hypothetical protein
VLGDPSGPDAVAGLAAQLHAPSPQSSTILLYSAEGEAIRIDPYAGCLKSVVFEVQTMSAPLFDRCDEEVEIARDLEVEEPRRRGSRPEQEQQDHQLTPPITAASNTLDVPPGPCVDASSGDRGRSR